MFYVISPHIDDAFFSLGLTIQEFLRRGDEVRIINCFSTSNFTIDKIEFDVLKVSRIRKNEDRLAGKAFQKLSFIYLDLLDAPLRGESIKQGLPLSQANKALAEVIADSISELAPDGSSLFFPLSVGNHIDHLICLEAALILFHSNLYKLKFYEDLPYCAKCTDQEKGKKINYIQFVTNKRMSSLEMMYSDCWRKELLVSKYSSQLNEKILNYIVSYTLAVGGERVWVIEPPNSDIYLR